MPGYTHLQRAQPVYLGHHLLAYFWMLAARPLALRLRRARAGRLPLGSGALAGVNFDTDRRAVAASSASRRSRRTRSTRSPNRDFILDYLGAAATCATHLSRLGAELVLWSSEEFGFCELPGRVELGLLDHAAEEEPGRRRAAARQGARVSSATCRRFHGVMHALPLTYNKDLQEDKEHLFDAVDTLELTLAAATGMVAGVNFDRERLREAASDEMIAATDVADLLVRLGMPFREAHGVVAGLVRTAVDGGKALSELTTAELATHSDTLAAHDAEYREVLAQSSWLESKVSEGGTALARVREQMTLARSVLDAGAAA
jgi:argininosuccinate lyase